MKNTKTCGGDVAWFVFESEEVIMGPYLTRKEAERDLDIQMTECYLEEDYPSPYIDFVEHEDDWVNWEEMDFTENRLYYESGVKGFDNLPFKQKIRWKFKNFD